MFKCGFRNSYSIPPQKSPVDALLFLLHNYLDTIQSMYKLGPGGNYLAEENEIKFIVLFLSLNGEIDGNLILIEFDLQIFLLFHNKRNLNTYFGRRLIPAISELGSQQLFLRNIFLTHLDDITSLQGSLLRCSNSLS